MAIDQATQDAITAAVAAATIAATESQKAANGRGSSVPAQYVEGQLTDDAGNLLWQLDDQGNQVLDSNNKPIPVMGPISIVTGKPRKTGLEIFQSQQVVAEQPDWNWNPSAGADEIPVKTPQQIADEQAKHQAAIDKAEEARKEFEQNMANIWRPNPQDAEIPAPTAKRDNPYKDPYAAPDFTLLPDPVTGDIPGVAPRDPWTGRWVVHGSSGLTTESTDSAAAAADMWNRLVTGWKNKP
ncbi:hypothetical protein EF72_21425 [Salmonella enterica]|nr:hypothetical protein [Salmonella enterica]